MNGKKKLVAAKRPRKASKPFKIIKPVKVTRKTKANVKDFTNGKKNPVFFDKNNPNHTHGKRGIKFHYDPNKPRMKPEVNNDRGTQTLGVSMPKSVAMTTDSSIQTNKAEVQRKTALVGFSHTKGSQTSRPLQTDNFTMTTQNLPPES